MNEDLRLGFASNDFAGTKWKNLTGTARWWSDGTEMVTLDYSHLTSVLWGVCKGFQARLDGGRRNMADARRRTIKAVYEDPHTGFGSIAQTLQQAQVRDPSICREEVKAFLDGLRVNQDRPQRGFVPLEPMNQLQVDLADMKAFGGKPYPFMLVAIDALTNKVAAEPLKDRLASTTAAGWGCRPTCTLTTAPSSRGSSRS